MRHTIQHLDDSLNAIQILERRIHQQVARTVVEEDGFRRIEINAHDEEEIPNRRMDFFHVVGARQKAHTTAALSALALCALATALTARNCATGDVDARNANAVALATLAAAAATTTTAA